MDWYKFDLLAYRHATHNLKPLEDLAYRRLLDLYYQYESPLPNDLDWIRLELHWKHKSALQPLSNVLSKYFSLDAQDNHWHNARADREIAEYKERSGKNKANADKRWNGANRIATALPVAMPKQTYIQTKKEATCVYKLENGQTCNKTASGITNHQPHCYQHDPYPPRRAPTPTPTDPSTF